jgi:plasmid stability protein
MPKNVQIRNVDDATYETLRARAQAQGLSLTRYLRRELDLLATTTGWAEIFAHVDERGARGAAVSREDIAAALEADRAERR